MIFGQVVPKNRPNCENRTIWGNRPKLSLIMQAYITLCFGISPMGTLHKKSIDSTHFECEQTLYILCYKSIFKLCMILTIGIQYRAFNLRLLREMWKKIHSQFTCCITYKHSFITRALVYLRLCAVSMRLWAGIRG